jgi:formiminoglutamase
VPAEAHGAAEDLRRVDPSDPAIAPPQTAHGDPRVGHLLGRSERPLVVLIGFPSDEGVRRNGGRPGAAEGPRELRRWLYRMTPDAERPGESVRLFERTRDLGDVVVTGDLEQDQGRLGRVMAAELALGRVPVILGGGHEVAYGHFLGHAGTGRPAGSLEVINWDAHPDVRELRGGMATSGSPFRQALEHPDRPCRRYRVYGLQRHAVAAAHVRWIEERGGTAVFSEGVDRDAVARAFRQCEGDTLVSFDLDAVDAAFAPGVSAPAACGLEPRLWLEAAEAAGECGLVRSIDIAELNPRHDLDGRTARLAALTVWRFLRGFALRSQASD